MPGLPPSCERTCAKVALRLAQPRTAGCRFEQFRLAEHAAGRGQPLKPRGAGEIVCARQHRRRGRHQSRFQPDRRAFGEPGTVGPGRQVDPYPESLPALHPPCQQHQPDPVLGPAFLARHDFGGQRGDRGPGERFGPDQRRFGPDRQHAGGGQRQHRKACAAQLRMLARVAERCQQQHSAARAAQQHRAPLPRPRQDEPGRDSRCESHRQPLPARERSGLQKGFGARCEHPAPTGQQRYEAPRRRALIWPGLGRPRAGRRIGCGRGHRRIG